MISAQCPECEATVPCDDDTVVGEGLQVAVHGRQPDRFTVGPQRRVDVLRAAEPAGRAQRIPDRTALPRRPVPRGCHGTSLPGTIPRFRWHGHTYAATGGQEQTRWRSPYAPSIRRTGGQYLAAASTPDGNAASAREYG